MALSSSSHMVQLREAYNRKRQELKKRAPRVLLLGYTGVGKSTLINLFFGPNTAKAGAGRPITSAFASYPATVECPVHLHDSEGFTATNADGQTKAVVEYLKAAEDNEPIDIVWFIVNAASKRFDDKLLQILIEGSPRVPVIIVINQCDLVNRDDLKDVMTAAQTFQHSHTQVKGIVKMAANPEEKPAPKVCPKDPSHTDIVVRQKFLKWACMECDPGETEGSIDATPYGAEELEKATRDLLPPLAKESFLAAQVVSLDAKTKPAIAILLGGCLSAYAVGWSPLPFSDAALLIPIQIGMLAGLSSLYSVPGFVALRLMSQGPAACGIVGLSIATGLKFIPGIGTLVGGLIDSSVAFVVTCVLGVVAIFLLRKVNQTLVSGALAEDPSAVQRVIESVDLGPIFSSVYKALWAKRGALTTGDEGSERLLESILDDLESPPSA